MDLPGSPVLSLDDNERAALLRQLQSDRDAALAAMLAQFWELGIDLGSPEEVFNVITNSGESVTNRFEHDIAPFQGMFESPAQFAELHGNVPSRLPHLKPKVIRVVVDAALAPAVRVRTGNAHRLIFGDVALHGTNGAAHGGEGGGGEGGGGHRAEPQNGDEGGGGVSISGDGGPSGTHAPPMPPRAAPPTPAPAPASSATPASQPASSPSPSHPTRAVPLRCLACFDDFPEHQLACATADPDPGPSTSTGGNASACGHFFCTTCMSAYVRGAVRERRYPIRCPMGPRPAGGGADPALPQSSGGASNSSSTGAGSSTSTAQGCGHALSREVVMGLLLDHPMEWQVFEQLEAEGTLAAETLLYCPHSGCSCPLVVEDAPPPNQPASCPTCHRGFCPTCRITGWHEGLTCAQFQALPPHQRSAADVAVLQLSEQQRWKPCPSCKHMVEKSSGCNHMACRCGAHFCYRCGVAYSGTSQVCTC